MHWIAALPMYNVAPALDADWRRLLAHVRERLADVLTARGDTFEIVDPGPDLTAFWLRDDVLLSQTCGYPLVHALADRVQLVGAPDFDLDGCRNGTSGTGGTGGTYCSVIVAGTHVAAESIDACRGLRAVYNDDDSNSGMNLFRHAIAPLAQDGRFFASATKTGAHLASLRALAEGRADVTAIDCVTFAFARLHAPELADGARVIGTTASSSALPFIASRRTPQHLVDTTFHAIADALNGDIPLARRLRLNGVVKRTFADYDAILDYERDAIARGYPRLA